MSKKVHGAAGTSRGAVAEAVPDAKHVGRRLVELCRQGKYLDAIAELYDDDIVSVEAQAAPEMPATMKGIDAIRGKNDWWMKNHEVHGGEAKGPFVNGERFTVLFRHDVTPKIGASRGRRTSMEEVAVYTVRDGRIVHEAFFS